MFLILELSLAGIGIAQRVYNNIGMPSHKDTTSLIRSHVHGTQVSLNGNLMRLCTELEGEPSEIMHSVA